MRATPVSLAISLMFLMLFALVPIRGDDKFVMIKEGNSLLVNDDFSKSPIEWRLLNASRWDAGFQQMVLTEPGSQRVGVIWLMNNITSTFTAEFRYRVGGGSGADGFVFMFYKDSDYEPGIGGYLGFLCRPVEKTCPRNEAPGYGLEFDSYFNSLEAYGMGDPSQDHIAFIKDDINNHLIYVNDSRVEDDIWHHVKLVVTKEEMIVFVDGDETLRWSGVINRTFGSVGFGSGIWGQDNKHLIDDFKIYGNTITITGLQPNWRVTLTDEDQVLATGVTDTNTSNVLLETTGLTMPLKGRFQIYDGNMIIYESTVFNEIWGGDIISLRPESDVTNTASTSKSSILTSTTLTKSIETGSESSIYSFALIATVVIIVVASVLLIMRRYTALSDSRTRS